MTTNFSPAKNLKKLTRKGFAAWLVENQDNRDFSCRAQSNKFCPIATFLKEGEDFTTNDTNVSIYAIQFRCNSYKPPQWVRTFVYRLDGYFGNVKLTYNDIPYMLKILEETK